MKRYNMFIAVITFIGCVHKFTLSIYSISEHFCLSVPEHRITDEFAKAQHPLNMTGVNVIKLLLAAQLVTNAPDNMKTT
jgi:hypothetical protein